MVVSLRNLPSDFHQTVSFPCNQASLLSLILHQLPDANCPPQESEAAAEIQRFAPTQQWSVTGWFSFHSEAVTSQGSVSTLTSLWIIFQLYLKSSLCSIIAKLYLWMWWSDFYTAFQFSAGLLEGGESRWYWASASESGERLKKISLSVPSWLCGIQVSLAVLANVFMRLKQPLFFELLCYDSTAV